MEKRKALKQAFSIEKTSEMNSFPYSSKKLSSQDPKLKLGYSHKNRLFKGALQVEVVMMPKCSEDN